MRFDRREFVGAGAAGLVVAGVEAYGKVPKTITELAGTAPAGTKPLTIDVTRREDFLFLRFELYNLKRVGQTFRRKIPGKTAYVVVTFVPQHLTERAFTGAPKPPGQAPARLSRPSRLAFRVPPGVKSFPATLEALLKWENLLPNLAPAAAHTSGAAPKLRAPTSRETAIELPWRLLLSPTKDGRWEHKHAGRTLDGWTELWKTELHPLGSAARGGALRAVWARDYAAGKADKDGPFTTTLTPHDRYQIVRATSDFKLSGRADARARRLALSSMGGFLDVRGAWNITKLSLAEWEHRTTLGRDQYVKVVHRGFLLPFGHKAAFVEIYERRFERVEQQTVAALRKIEYLVVLQPSKSYVQGQFGVLNDSRDLPFRTLEITTLRTPNLTASPKLGSVETSVVPMVGPNDKPVPFRFALVGTDRLGRRVDFTAPAVFVEDQPMYNAGKAGGAVAEYNKPGYVELRSVQLNGQTLAAAESKKPGDTDIEVKTLTFQARAGAEKSEGDYRKAGQPRCFPKLAQAEVRLAAAEQASGGKPLAKSPVVSYVETYVTNEFDSANAGKVFMELLKESVPKLEFAGGSGGGVMTPNFLVNALSRSRGPVADSVKDLADGIFKPKEFFKDALAKILGGVDLADLLDTVNYLGDDPDSKVLKLTTKRDGTKLTTTLSFTPEIVDNPIITTSGDDFRFALEGKITTDLLHPEQTETEILGELEHFAVNLMTKQTAKFIVLTFKKVAFESRNGQKPKPDVDLDTVKFVGALEFVEKLQKLMDFSGEGGPKIEIQPSGITATLAVPVPSIGVGILSISNINLGFGFNLPFTGDPARFRFDFSTREDPFALSVAIFGGGGYFGLALGTDGVELIEAALEFGAQCSFDIGVASGGVHLLAGIYFSYGTDLETDQETCVVTGYVRMGGELSILGIIHLSLEFYMGLTYKNPPKVVYGEAILTVEVEILFFSVSVELKVRREFGGGGGGGKKKQLRNSGVEGAPTFADQIDQAAWDEYCEAYA